MWTDLLSNNKGIKAIYKEKEPSLDVVRITTMHISPSYLHLSLEWDDMPTPLPKRWAENDAKSCTVLFSIYNNDQTPIFKYADLNVNDKEMKVQIELLENDKKRVVISNQERVRFLEIEADIVYMIGIGYK